MVRRKLLVWGARGQTTATVVLSAYLWVLSAAAQGTPQGFLDAKVREFFGQVPPLRQADADNAGSALERNNYEQLVGEKAADKWFAALVSTSPGSRGQIEKRFTTWKGFTDFVTTTNVLVELWASSERDLSQARRIPATELAELRRQSQEVPVVVTVAYLDAGKALVQQRVEFGFGAAEIALAAQQGYARERDLQVTARRILGAQDDRGHYSAIRQWEELQEAIKSGEFPIVTMPEQPYVLADLLVAVEYQVDEANQIRRPVRLWHGSELRPRVVKDAPGQYVQVLLLKGSGEEEDRQVRAFRAKRLSDDLEPVVSPVPGQDSVELRVKDPFEADPRKWNVLEFGSPEIARQASVAQFSLINAYLQKRRKEVALRKSKIDLFAEPAFAGLNIGGGLAAVPFPIGEAARLGYNALVAPWFIPPVPGVDRMRDLFRVLAAREKDPVLSAKPARYLDADDIRILQERASRLTTKEFNEYLYRIQEEDLRAMLRLAKMQQIDQEITLLLNLLTGSAKVSGWADDGLPKDIFNSVYFSLNGDISIKNIIAVLAGGKNATPLSGASLHHLAQGGDPQIAWLQYLDLTVDVRAVANTISRLLHPDLADRELKMPFPYATRMTDPAAYEIRIFGYPLLMYYKRGLMKADYAAFQDDYAYGLIASHIVEHFPTRESMDVEIRAGRMVPLGFVRVPDASGRWKESNLAVFAHRVPAGKHKGKTTVILYGLKAFEDQSELIGREYQRLQQFEQALREGGVIEQIIDSDNRDEMQASALEPIIFPGPGASEEHFSPLLGKLLEWQRVAQLQAWGRQISADDSSRFTAIRRELESAGITSENREESPLVGVDRFSSSFIYKRVVDGRHQIVRLVNIPARPELQREVAKATTAAEVERARRVGTGPDGQGIVLLNSVRRVGDNFEIGPLLQDKEGRVIGVGVRTGAEAVVAALGELNRLPITQRARLRYRHYASTLVDLDLTGSGTPTKTFITIEFPPGKLINQISTNSATGELEMMTYDHGRLTRVTSARKTVELEYNTNEIEVASRTYVNRGTLMEPRLGELLEETKSVQAWNRNLDTPDIDPYQPLLSKAKVNHITGALGLEVYGLFSLPVQTADEFLSTTNTFDAQGNWISARVFENGMNEQDFQRDPIARILHPLPGQPRFDLTTGSAGDPLKQGKLGVVRTNLLKQTVTTEVYDTANFGRLLAERWTDELPGLMLREEVTREYRDDFFHGQVPWRATRTGGPSGVRQSEAMTVTYDPLTRSLAAVETDHTGQHRTNWWEPQWKNPVRVDTATRISTNWYDRAETTVRSATMSRTTGEELAIISGRFDSVSRTWSIEQTGWFRPGITNRVEVETRSPFGRLISSRVPGLSDARPIYSEAGLEEGREVFRADPATGAFTVPQRREDDYRFSPGNRSAQVHIFIDGKPYDDYRLVTDADGRAVEDGIRALPGLSLSTRVLYEGDSERVVRAEDFLNGTVRTTRQPLEPSKQADGTWRLSVLVTPAWGLISTQEFRLADGLGRALQTTFENGRVLKVSDWFPGSAIPWKGELVDRRGTVLERFVKTPNARIQNGIPIDINSRSKVSPWGESALASAESLVRGTDVMVSTEGSDERTYFDLRQSRSTPRYAIDAHADRGVAAVIDGVRVTNVLSLYRSAILPAQANGPTNLPARLMLEKADLEGLFYFRVTQQVFDRAGEMLSETISRISAVTQFLSPAESVFDAPRVNIAQFTRQHDPGWLIEIADGGAAGRMLVYTNQQPQSGTRLIPVNDGPFPDLASEINGKIFGTAGVEDPGLVSTHFPRRLHSPRFLEHNPHLPGVQGLWSRWTSTDYRQNGTRLFDLETIYDGQGRPSVSRTTKTTSLGETGTRATYYVIAPPPDELKRHSLGSGQQTLALNVGREELSRSDFLYFFAPGLTNYALVFKDGSGRSATVRPGNSDYSKNLAEPWTVHPMHVRWVPDDAQPLHGAELVAVGWSEQAGLITVATYDLARAHLDVSRIRSMELVVTNESPVELSISTVQLLDRVGPYVPDAVDGELVHRQFSHSSGLRTVITSVQGRTEREAYAGQKMDALVEYNGLPVATARAHGKLARFPHVLWLDTSGVDVPRPLYSIADDDGHFLEQFRSVRLGDGQLAVSPPSFEVPRLEIYRGNILEDELYPGIIAYGRQYSLAIPTARGVGFPRREQALLRQRVEANGFRFGGEHLLKNLPILASKIDSSPRPDYLRFQDAATRANEVTQSPMLAQALAARRELPWVETPVTSPLAPAVNWGAFGLRLNNLQLPFYNYTKLIPTALGTEAERYVDTVAEAKLIVLALRLGDKALARSVLDFYLSASNQGQKEILASYDGVAGTGMEADVLHQRPGQADPTAEAQLAIAEASLQLGLLPGDSKYLTFGRNLLTLTLNRFRPPADKGPRGVAESPVLSPIKLFGPSLWPDPNEYTLRSNVRLYLILKRLNDVLSQSQADPAWQREILAALREQSLFLTALVLPEVERTGVVPSGVFEIQDLDQENSALAVERWTSAEDWLLFLEAAVELGVPQERCRTWLENLARVHGVRVGPHWGLDWRVALLRPDAISPGLTAQFLRMAHLVGHSAAETFASSELAGMENQGGFPAAITERPANRALMTAQGYSVRPSTNHTDWPVSLAVYPELRERERDRLAWDVPNAPIVTSAATVEPISVPKRGDRNAFIIIAGGVYASVLGLALFWWGFRALRRKPMEGQPDMLVPESVMELAEERWAKHVLGLSAPANAEHWRFSNAPVEQNFLTHMRAIYKLVLEWRRLENDWAEDDRRLAEDTSDPWLNGADELSVLLGLYMRSVIKAGTKDGFPADDVLAENEDSNHIWARLTMYLAEHLWSITGEMREWKRVRGGPEQDEFRDRMLNSLEILGVRQRKEPFDGRELFNYPANPQAMDLLVVQKADMTVTDVMQVASFKLEIPFEHILRVVNAFKVFKRREKLLPIHPFFLELAKEIPHFSLMGLGAIIFYNEKIGDQSILEFLKAVFGRVAFSAQSLLWAVPLLISFICSVITHFLRVYRFEGAIRPREKPDFILDATVTSMFVKRHAPEAKERKSRWAKPEWFERVGWVFRALGFSFLALMLYRLDTPSFGTFLVVKGLFATLVLFEISGVVLPLIGSWISMVLQDYVSRHPSAPHWIQFANRLNITATRPVSSLWLSIKYHAQPSMPTGTPWGLVQAVCSYFLLAAAFFFGAGYLCQQIFPLWFTDTYLDAKNWKLALGSIFFGVTMVLLRYGLFLLLTSIGSLLAAFPLLTVAGCLALGQLIFTFYAPLLNLDRSHFNAFWWTVSAFALAAAAFDKPIAAWVRRSGAKAQARADAKAAGDILAFKEDSHAALGIIYMSGDELSALKLTPDLLMTRWEILRDRLDSQALSVLARVNGLPDDKTLRSWFQNLYDAEKGAAVTLWHPIQLCITTQGMESPTPRLSPELGLNIPVTGPEHREQLLAAWHLRRWLTSMMSTAGHSQDTAINLVDMALRLEQEGLSSKTVFYLIQNKYDAAANNRPSQMNYGQGELDHRNKLARLLAAVAPGSRSWCVFDWTPFGFKSGGLTGMDLIYDETMRLSTLLLLDRNATVHDLDALMLDLKEALTDPNLIIVIPGRSTTNTLTPLGQASQLVEEGHRSFLRGLFACMGGTASESVGTGWGNMLACFYGRVQRALLSHHQRMRPLTSRMQRGTSFADKTEGLIGFGPHAVGISEDIWAVVQAMNNALGLGLRPRFALSRAMWHKIRETWSHAEWLASFPRWAGGYFQMASDPLMQRINDMGPQPVFARDIRSSSGRHFLSAPIAFFNILFMPLAIIFDVSPFVQTLFVLWNCGFVLNQVLTLHALDTYVESAGFYRLPALAGAVAMAALSFLVPSCRHFGPGLVLLGFVLGGFFVGVSRWLCSRLRDLILFGPQLVLQTLAHTVRLSLEFIVSGTSAEDAKQVNMAWRAWAGPREDRPLEKFPNFINLRTVIWGVGLLSTVLSLFALANLDMLNVLLLLPSLLFSISTLAGPYLITPMRGKPLGVWALVPRLLAWLTAAVFYTVVSLAISWGGWNRYEGIALLLVVFGVVLSRGLRYVFYSTKIDRLRRFLTRVLADAAVKPALVPGLVQHILSGATGDVAKLQPELQKAAVGAGDQAVVLDFVRLKVAPVLRAPVSDMQKGLLSRSRFANEWTRSFVLALFVLLWFFLVPVPGLIVFTAGSYRFTIGLELLLTVLGSAIVLVLLSDLVARFFQWMDMRGFLRPGLYNRVQTCFERLRTMDPSNGPLTPAETASVFALLTDTQTYIDQRGYAYARRSLEIAEGMLRQASLRSRSAELAA